MPPKTAETVIKGGIVIDPTGSRLADVRIAGGEIVEVG